jgi:tetratricopeptide (TPR) repeat protein
MSKAIKGKKKNTYESLRAEFYSGKVKPTLTKIIAELANDAKNIKLVLLACQCLQRTKNIQDLTVYADLAIQLDAENAAGYYYKGIALQHTKGKEQEALKNLNMALTLNPDHTVYLKTKAITHLVLFKDLHLPIQLAKKHGAKAEEILLKIIELIEQKEKPDYVELLTLGDVFLMINKGINAKMNFSRAENVYLSSAATKQDKNSYKDILKAQVACAKFLDKIIEE